MEIPPLYWEDVGNGISKTGALKLLLAAVLLFQTGPFQPGPSEQEGQVWNAAVVVAPVAGEKVSLKLSWCATGLGDFQM